MKNVSVVYATKTKHSKKLADAIAAALNVPARNAADHPGIGENDLLFIVGGVYGGQSLPEMQNFVSALESAQVKSVALVTSSVSVKAGQDDVRRRLESLGIPVTDEYRCAGSLLFFHMGHPNRKEVENAVDFAVRLAEKEG